MSSPLIPRVGARIAVIGAGPAGLAATRLFAKASYETHTYEANSEIGGIWNRFPKSPVYDSLRCNIPAESMGFSDFPFSVEKTSFPPHEDVQAYLRSYAAEYDLERHIRFDAQVTGLQKEDNLWNLTTKSTTELYHAVLICIGHHTKPRMWDAPGQEFLRSKNIPVIHSWDYREPSQFKDKDVLVVGAGPSGVDMSIDVASVARKVTLAHGNPRVVFPKRPPTNLRETCRPKRVLPSGEIELDDGTTIAVDIVLACTGYLYELPFLQGQESVGVEVSEDGRYFKGLVALCLARKDPTLALIGTPITIVPFPLFEDQVRFTHAVLEGRISTEQLNDWAREEDRIVEDVFDGDLRSFTVLRERQWEYRRRLASAAGSEMPEQSRVEVYRDSSGLRKVDPIQFRECQYEILGTNPGEWRAILDGKDITGLQHVVDDVFHEPLVYPNKKQP